MLYIGMDMGSPEGDATVYSWRLPNGQILIAPDYLPAHWLDRITPEWGADRNGVFRWHFLWTGWNNGKGHAKVRRDGKAIYCHRDIVERMQSRKLKRWDYVDHLCERKNCLTYECLEAVPPGENTQRGPGALHQFKPAAAYLRPEPLQGTYQELWEAKFQDPLDGL